jgi:hypothetical protein
MAWVLYGDALRTLLGYMCARQSPGRPFPGNTRPFTYSQVILGGVNFLPGDSYFFGADNYLLPGDSYFFEEDDYFFRFIVTFLKKIITFSGL